MPKTTPLQIRPFKHAKNLELALQVLSDSLESNLILL